MSLPIVMIFERHWDESPKHVLNSLLPKLAEQGYDTLCLEEAEDLKVQDFHTRLEENVKVHVDLHESALTYLKKANVRFSTPLSTVNFTELTYLMRMYVSSRRYVEVAEKIKQLPALLLFQKILKDASRLSIQLQGVDIHDAERQYVVRPILTERAPVIRETNAHREATIVNNLLRLQETQKGIVFSGGVAHANAILNAIKKKNPEVDLLCCFPHSSKLYDDAFDDCQDFKKENIPEHHAYLVDTEEEAQAFANRIVLEIKAKNTRYTKELIGENSHLRSLSAFFKRQFRAFERPGHYVDALLEIDQIADVNALQQQLEQLHVSTKVTDIKGKRYFTISDINTPEVAESIRHKLAARQNS
ncbi:MAG: hypothetical protein K0S07_150 [Chlamydiales bacterium]|nr:hypothetical protein [Chlamydiales bacterium]